MPVANIMSFTWSASGTKSDAIDLSGWSSASLCGLFMPSTFTGTTLTFEACDSLAGTYVPVQDGAGSSYSLTVGTSRYIPITSLPVFYGTRFLKAVSGSSEAQGREIKAAVREIL